jgi:hypothetical protein
VVPTRLRQRLGGLQITNYHDCGTNGTYAKLEARRATKANVTSTLNAITTTMRQRLRRR